MMHQKTSDRVGNRPRFYGLGVPNVHVEDVFCGEAVRLDLRGGSTLSVTNVDGGATAVLTVLLPEQPRFSATPLAVAQEDQVPLPIETFDAREMEALAHMRDGLLANATGVALFDGHSEPGALYVTKLEQDCIVFVIAPVERAFAEMGGGSHFAVRVQPPTNASLEENLPRPLGRIKDEWRVARGTALAYELKKGQFVQVIDVEGQQCSDFLAMRASALDSGLERYIDSTVSRTMARAAYPLPGLHDKFYDQDMRPLLAVRQDTVVRHDTFALACTARGYEDRGFPGHLNCSDNISDAFAP